MKRTILYITSVFVLSMTSCTKDFEEINTNPNTVENANPNFLFSSSQLDAFNNNYFYTSVLECGGLVQHYATYKEASGVGDKYLDNSVYYNPYFNLTYVTAVNEVAMAARLFSVKPEDSNKFTIARIWKAYIFHRITDLYGDVPYFDASKGSTDLVFTPKYDSQESIYKDLLKELDEAALALDPAKPSLGSADLIYQGDVTKWKKFSYSLMLRLGLRLSKVDPALSKAWVQKAIAGGVILNGDDNALLKYTNGPKDFNKNPAALDSRINDFSANSFGQKNTEGGKLAKTFIDVLKATSDPRISVYSGVWVGTNQDNSPAIQKGFPNGLKNAPSAADQGTYSEPNQQTVFRLDAPLVILSNAETHLYMAEAAARGWFTGDTDKNLFENAVKASFLNAGIYGSSHAINNATPYLLANPYNVAGSFDAKMNQIHTQVWIALFIDEQEVYANWRRTGYPILTPVNFPGNVTNGVIPRRLKYPSTEAAVNTKSYTDAVARQGADTFTTKMWWDK
ncbi:SusD/RagB family nutrient-binding outer membrane lipoprotein [Flavobacterium weaverense]|uniref:SusD-like starch-binding protein associating with outer membrane n=1 Tax=Flavobacterium weaverense TaxID=271156 RepID=A0A3L9ZXU3_9FLAO|nr:SusD/RagB family nutrient-binding outer membrane lipoprotein [Flavobacterium weaverense]RMA76029.1 SusD-like starch-binding protein associating with outer membrane [Flavobacterium weaverense]